MADTDPVGRAPGLMRVSAGQATIHPDTGRGWVVFAGVMLLMAAVFTAVYGLTVLGFGHGTRAA
jgi:hypothetical protein